MKSLRARLVVFSAWLLCMATLSAAQDQWDRVQEARRQLTTNPCDLQALGVLTNESRAHLDTASNPQQSLAELTAYSHRGLACVNQTGGSGTKEFLTIFEGGAGFAALQRKDYDEARSYYRAALENAPSDLENVYQFALTNLLPKPPNAVEGLFFLARAVILAEKDSPVQIAIEKYALKKYRGYHGSVEGWDEVVVAARENVKPPAGFTIIKSWPQVAERSRSAE